MVELVYGAEDWSIRVFGLLDSGCSSTILNIKITKQLKYKDEESTECIM